MKGWLATREGLLRTERYYFRLQWGFLSQHLTETSAATLRYFIHGARVHIARVGLRVVLEFGELGAAFAAHQGTPTRIVLMADNVRMFHAWITCMNRAKSRDIRRWYEFGEALGRGVDGIVKLGIGIETRHLVAIKRISIFASSATAGVKLRRVLREIQLQHKAAKRSSNVAAIFDVFYDKEFCYMVMQYGNKGSLCRLLSIRNGILHEEFVRSVIIQLGRCVMSMHQNNIVHRDIKCDNVLIALARQAPLKILLCDFGFATVWRPESKKSMSTFCGETLGTESYLAPEILRGDRYGAPADIFALGVLCHICLTGAFPFESPSRRVALRKIERGRLRHLEGSKVSQNAKSFTRALLCKSPHKRLTAVALLQHLWLRGHRERFRPHHGLRHRPTSFALWRRAFHAVNMLLKIRRLGQGIDRAYPNQQISGVSFRPYTEKRHAKNRNKSLSLSEVSKDEEEKKRSQSEFAAKHTQGMERRQRTDVQLGG